MSSKKEEPELNALLTKETESIAEPSITIRPFTSEDYVAISEIHNSVFPEYKDTPEEMRTHDDNRAPKCKWTRLLAVTHEGKVIGYSSYSQHEYMYHPRKFELDVCVFPDWQNQGIGTKLYEAILEALVPYDPIHVRAHTREDMTSSVAFLAKREFAEEQRDWESRLNIVGFDFAPFAGAEERVASQGIVIKTLRALEADPNRNRKLHELDCIVSRDMPSPDANTDPDFEPWEKDTFENPNLIPDGYFIAVDTATNAYVGVSQLWNSQAIDDLYTGATGVRPDYRRRGIALALKLNAIRYAKSIHCPTVRTWNAQSNRAMLSINEALGFVKQPAWISYGKKLKEENE